MKYQKALEWCVAFFFKDTLKRKSHALHSWKDTVAGRQARQAFISAVGDKQTKNKARKEWSVIAVRRKA